MDSLKSFAYKQILKVFDNFQDLLQEMCLLGVVEFAFHYIAFRTTVSVVPIRPAVVRGRLLNPLG